MQSNSSIVNSFSPCRGMFRLFGLLVLFVFCSGCGTSTSTVDGVTSYKITAASHLIFGAIGLLLFVGGIVALLISLQKEGSKPLYESIAIVGGVIVLFGLVPGAMMSRVTVSDTRMSINCGSFWFGRDVMDFNLRELSAIQTEERERWSRRGRRIETWYKFVLTNGTTFEIKSNGMLKEAVPQVGSMIQSAEWNARQEAGGGATVNANVGSSAADVAANDGELAGLLTVWPDLFTVASAVPEQANFGGSQPEGQNSGFPTPFGATSPAPEGYVPPNFGSPNFGSPNPASSDNSGLTVGTRVMVQFGTREAPGIITEVVSTHACRVDVERDGRTIPLVIPKSRMKIIGSSEP